MTNLNRRIYQLEDRARAEAADGELVRNDLMSRLAGRDVYLPANWSYLDFLRDACERIAAENEEDGDRGE